MEWSVAQEEALAQWRGIHAGIGRRDPTIIVIELNEAGALCARARELAGSDAERCAHCIVFGDAWTCAAARFEVTSALLAGELETARAATLSIVARIATARPPKVL